MENIYKKLFDLKQKGITLKRDTKAFNYHYATLDQIQEKIGKYLEELKLIVIHQVIDGYVVTQVRNIEGDDFVESKIKMSDDVKAQDKGSEITYFRRYNLLCLLDLEVEDDDGKKAQDSSKKDEKPWFNEKEYSELDSFAILATPDQLKAELKRIKSNYRISDFIKDKLVDLQTKYIKND